MGRPMSRQVYFGAHGHADGIWVAAKDLHYFDDARERVMVYPGVTLRCLQFVMCGSRAPNVSSAMARRPIMALLYPQK